MFGGCSCNFAVLMTHTQYQTVSRPSSILLKIKGSKFYAEVQPFAQATDLKELIEGYSKKYPSAGHHCFAYRLDPNTEEERASDDGEPSGTAGQPILGQLYANNLHYTLCVVSRIFGGTKLGTGGLRSAYKEAAAEAIAASKIITPEIQFHCVLTLPVEKTFEVHQFANKYGGKIISEAYKLQDAKMEIQLPVKVKESLDEWLKYPDNQTLKIVESTLTQF